MKKPLIIFLLVIGLSGITFGQIRFGPTVELGYGMYSNKSDKIDLKGGISPAFGITFDKYLNYWSTLRVSALYSFKTLKTVRKSDDKADKMNGQFVDLCLAGRFSDFDDAKSTLPYGMFGFGAVFNVASTGQTVYMKTCAYKQVIPYVTVGVGTGIKLTFFSSVDVSINYSRFLAPMFVNPLDAKDAKLNQFSLKFAGLF